jgi:integrase/recombinase XerD
MWTKTRSFRAPEAPVLSMLDHKPNKVRISDSEIKEYIEFRKAENISRKWAYQVNLYIKAYIKYCGSEITKNKTLQYLNFLRSGCHRATYRKQLLQIRKFLQYEGINWLDKMKIVSEPISTPKRVPEPLLNACKTYFEGHKHELQAHALIELGSSSGMRATEIYRLNISDVDLESRSIILEETKEGSPRIVFFSEDARMALLAFCRGMPRKLVYLFGEFHCRRMFKDAPLQVKDMRKYFLQEWNRRGGNYLIGEILVGHSIRQNISLSHYVAFSNDELKKEYDRIMN